MSKFPSDIIAAAQASQRKYYVPTSVTLAQWALESNYGKSMPIGSFNPFGIKARPGEPTVEAGTTEVIHGGTVHEPQPFRKYKSFEEAFDAHGHLLASVSLYKNAIKTWLKGDLAGGVISMAKHYATAPNYATVLLSIIKSNNLTQYDKV